MLKYLASPLLFLMLLTGWCIFDTTICPAYATPALNEKTKQKHHATASTKKKSEPPKHTVKRCKILPKTEVATTGSSHHVSSHTKKHVQSRHHTGKLAASKHHVAQPADTEESTEHQNDKLQKQLTAKCFIIMNAATGETISAQAPDTPRQPASTIKILTGLIAIKSLKANDTVSVSYKAAEQPSSKVNLEKKKTYKADDLINAVLLASANDASVALAEKIAGSENSFARMMTVQAKLCGAQKTICKTANGLTAEGQSTTARDLATIFRYAMENEEFSKRMKQVQTHTTEGKLLRNHNKALWQIEGAEGGKTGFTNAAGQTYVGKFKRDSREIIVAIMGSHTMWGDLKTLVEYGFSQEAVAAEHQAPHQHASGKTTIVAGLESGKKQQ